MADVVHTKIEDIDALSGYLDGIEMRQVAKGLGVGAFGISIVEMDPHADAYPEHDHSPEGLGGEMFAKRPQQLGQEEVYVALAGGGTIEADGERFPIDGDHIIRVGPAVKRKIVAGPEGLRLLALGGTRGAAYETGGTL
jgi:mannose-6-phosphate isomerase-like protein (cupin superfamily)